MQQGKKEEVYFESEWKVNERNIKRWRQTSPMVCSIKGGERDVQAANSPSSEISWWRQ